MKISTDQLRRIILNEKRKILKEQLGDDSGGESPQDQLPDEGEAVESDDEVEIDTQDSDSTDIDGDGVDDRYVTVTAQTPKGTIEIELWDRISGVETGFGMVANPHYIEEGEPGHDPDWRWKDGRTVVGVPEDHPRALPVGDAYYELYEEWADDGYSTPIDDQMGWPGEQPEDEMPDEDAGGSHSQPDEHVRSKSGMWMLKPAGESEWHDNLPAQMGMGRRPSGRHGRGQLSERSVSDMWMKIAGIDVITEAAPSASPRNTVSDKTQGRGRSYWKTDDQEPEVMVHKPAEWNSYTDAKKNASYKHYSLKKK